jgi:hypothetical protein
MKLKSVNPPEKLFDRDMCTMDKEQVFLMAKVLNEMTKLPLKCHYCKRDITVDNISAVVNRPDRIICSHIHCQSEFVTEEEFRAFDKQNDNDV